MLPFMWEYCLVWDVKPCGCKTWVQVPVWASESMNMSILRFLPLFFWLEDWYKYREFKDTKVGLQRPDGWTYITGQVPSNLLLVRFWPASDCMSYLWPGAWLPRRLPACTCSHIFPWLWQPDVSKYMGYPRIYKSVCVCVCVWVGAKLKHVDLGAITESI